MISHFDENGQYHCDDGPAFVSEDQQIYYKHGVIHRVGGPALISKNLEIYYNNGVIHRAGGPAFITPDSYTYYNNGVIHRENGPARVIMADSYFSHHYYSNGVIQMIKRYNCEPSLEQEEIYIRGEISQNNYYQNDRIVHAITY